MIRINLLATERKTKAASPAFQAGQKMMVLGSLVLVVTIALLGWRYWSLGQQDAQVARDRGEQLQMIDLNVRALTELSLAFVDSIARHNGGILNVASLASFLPLMVELVAGQREFYPTSITALMLFAYVPPLILVLRRPNVAPDGDEGAPPHPRSAVPAMT